MKLLLTALLLVSTTASAFDLNCTQREAQFIGVIKDKRVHKVDNGIYDCYYKIAFSSYQASGVCPLAEEVATQEIAASSCNFEDGDAISGYLVEQNDQLRVE